MKTIRIISAEGAKEVRLCDGCENENWRFYCYRQVQKWRLLALTSLLALAVVTVTLFVRTISQ